MASLQADLMGACGGASSRGRSGRIFGRVLRPSEQICCGCVRLPHWRAPLHLLNSKKPPPRPGKTNSTTQYISPRPRKRSGLILKLQMLWLFSVKNVNPMMSLFLCFFLFPELRTDDECWTVQGWAGHCVAVWLCVVFSLSV